jgi:hypothetical protein
MSARRNRLGKLLDEALAGLPYRLDEATRRAVFALLAVVEIRAARAARRRRPKRGS